MSYCTLQDLIDRYGEDQLIQLSDRVNAGIVDMDVINGAIADAGSLVDGYLGSRYNLPINPVPLSLTRLASEITRYYLQKGVVEEDVEKRYQNAVKLLEKMAAGTLSIGISSIGEKPPSKNTVIMHTGGNVFNRDDKSFL